MPVGGVRSSSPGRNARFSALIRSVYVFAVVSAVVCSALTTTKYSCPASATKPAQPSVARPLVRAPLFVPVAISCCALLKICTRVFSTLAGVSFRVSARMLTKPVLSAVKRKKSLFVDGIAGLMNLWLAGAPVESPRPPASVICTADPKSPSSITRSSSLSNPAIAPSRIGRPMARPIRLRSVPVSLGDGRLTPPRLSMFRMFERKSERKSHLIAGSNKVRQTKHQSNDAARPSP